MLDSLWENDRSNNTIHYGRYESLTFKHNSYLNKVLSYYGTSSMYIKRPNPILSLINSLGINFNLPYIEMYDSISSDSNYLANTIGFVNTTNKNSKPFNSSIIKDMNEYIILDDSSFNFSNYDECLTPIKCIYTTLDSIFLTHPTKYSSTSEDDYSIYSININMLGMAYYYWGKRQIFIERDTDIARFLFEVIFTNTIPSINDLSLLNRFTRLKLGSDVSSFINDNPFDVMRLDRNIDSMFEWIISHYKKHSVKYTSYLENIPLLISKDSLEVLPIDIGYYNKRNKWLLWLARLPYIIFLLETIDDKDNKDTINDISIELDYAERNQVFNLKDKNTMLILNNLVSKVKYLIGK